ncbi:TPA: hypothetical protein ACQ31I_002427 [Yersinia enterocolitica]
MTLRNLSVISTLVIALVFLCFNVNLSVEIKNLLKKYSLLNNKLVNHSSLAARLKMEKVTKTRENYPFNESIDNALATLINDDVIKFKRTNMAHGSILLSIENTKFINFIDFFFMLSQDENIEVSEVDVKYTKNGDYINCQIILRKK